MNTFSRRIAGNYPIRSSAADLPPRKTRTDLAQAILEMQSWGDIGHFGGLAYISSEAQSSSCTMNDWEDYSEKHYHFYSDFLPELLNKYLTLSRWKTCLDLGCGDGATLYAMKVKGLLQNKIVYAVDISQTALERVREIDNSIICLVEDASDINSIDHNSIDFLISSQVIEHVPNDEAMIKEMNRVLRKDGLVFLSTVFKRPWARYFYRNNGKWVIDPTHLREYESDAELLEKMTGNGFRILENKKSPLVRPVVDFFVSRIGVARETYLQRPSLRLFRRVKMPIIGYFWWEIVCIKK